MQVTAGLTGKGASCCSSFFPVEVGRAAFSFSVKTLPLEDDEEGRDDEDEVGFVSLLGFELPLDGFAADDDELELGRDDELSSEDGLVGLFFAIFSEGSSTSAVMSSIK